MEDGKKPPSDFSIIAIIILTLIIGSAAYFWSPTQNHYNPADKHQASSDEGYAKAIVSMPDKVDPIAQATQSYTASEKEEYVAERSDLAAQWATARYTFVGLIMGGMGLFILIMTYMESSKAAYFTERALNETKLNSRRELRAYLKVEVDVLNIYKSINIARGATDYDLVRFCVGVENCGSTPAKSVEISFSVYKDSDTFLNEPKWAEYGDGFLINPNQEVLLEYAARDDSLGKVLREKLTNRGVPLSDSDVIMAMVAVQFYDIFDKKHVQVLSFRIPYSTLETAPKTDRKKIRDESGVIVKNHKGDVVYERVKNFNYVEKAPMLLVASDETTEEA